MRQTGIASTDAAVGRMFAVLGFGEALGRLVGFAGTVYIARRLGADAYGVLAVAAAVVLYFSHVADFSIDLLGARTIAQDRGSIERLVPPLLSMRLLLGVACIVVLGSIGLLLLHRPDGVILAITALGLLGVSASTKFVFLGLERPVPVALAKVGGELLSLVLIVLLVRGAGDLATAAWARVVGDIAAPIVLFLLLRRWGYALLLRHAPGEVMPTLVSAAPLVGHAILGLAIFNSDLIFLRLLRDAGTAGMYAAAYTLISFFLNLGVAYGNSLLPVFSRLMTDRPRLRAVYDDAMAQAFTAALPIAVGGSMLASGLIALVFGPAYEPAATAMRVLLWSVLAAAVRTVVTFSLIAHDQQSFVLRTTVWAAVANLALNIALIPRFGMLGAAVATLATEVLRTGVALVYSGQHGMPFGLPRRAWRAVVATGAMALAVSQIPAGPTVLATLALGVAVYFIVLAAVGGVRLIDRRPVLTV